MSNESLYVTYLGLFGMRLVSYLVANQYGSNGVDESGFQAFSGWVKYIATWRCIKISTFIVLGTFTGEELSSESSESQWALVDFGDEISVVPIESVAAKKNDDGTINDKMVMVTCTWKGKKRQYDAVILFKGT